MNRLSLDKIALAELEQIRLRRAWLKESGKIAATIPQVPDETALSEAVIDAGGEEAATTKISAIGQDSMELAGLALSGGGIRSAAFCLGVLQALNRTGTFARFDYMSTVSGGGYIGSALTATSYATRGQFAFDRLQGKQPDPRKTVGIDDSPVVSHIRNYSNFLAPRGFRDWIASAALLARGLVTNMFMIAPWILLCASVTLLYNPGRASLTAAGPRLLEARLEGGTTGWLAAEFETFGWPAAMAGLLVLYFLLWSMLRSSKRFGKTSEFKGAYAKIGGWALVALAVATFLSVQNSLFALLLPSAAPAVAESKVQMAFSESLFAIARSALLTSPLIVILVSLFGDSLARFATEEATAVSRKLAKHASKLALLAGALALPALLWLVYLRIVYWGLLCNEPAATCLKWLPAPDAAGPIGVYLPAIAIALLALALMAVMRWLKPNAYSLHRLYRDRLAKAFVIHPTREDPKNPGDRDMLYALKMSQLVRKAEPPSELRFVHGPFPLMNTALNVQSSALVNRRGRNADFFVFTPLHAGSMATGYVSMKRLEAADPTLDLAAVMAISGAAASSNMGANTIRPMSTTLALLNVRLGYWLPNPKKLIEHGYRAKRGLFLWQEMTSLLDENTANVLLTDGGHIENLGIYELLRRRCKLIVAVDAEADRGMNFGSFIAL